MSHDGTAEHQAEAVVTSENQTNAPVAGEDEASVSKDEFIHRATTQDKENELEPCGNKSSTLTGPMTPDYDGGSGGVYSDGDDYIDNGQEEAETEHAEGLDGATAKELGIRAFKEQRIDEAVTHWQRGVRSCCYILSKNIYDGDQKKEIQLLEMTLHLNLSLAHLKLGNYSKCVSHADKALSVDSKNVKAFYRKASALIEMCRFDEAMKSLDALLALEPNNDVARLSRARAARAMHKAAAKEKRMMKQVFSSLENDPRVQDHQNSNSWRHTLRNITSKTLTATTAALQMFAAVATFINAKCCKRRLAKTEKST